MYVAAEGSAPSSPALRGTSQPSDPDFYHLRHVTVTELLSDGSLGLLLNGTSVVGFRHHEVKEFGWAADDQIVELNGVAISSFEDFLEQFSVAREAGCPMYFAVLRREYSDGIQNDDAGIESILQDIALESFLSSNNFWDLSGRLERKSCAAHLPCDSASSFSTNLPDEYSSGSHVIAPITENPYIQCLRQRRDELFRSAEGWRTEVAESLASRLATERCDALAMLKPLRHTPRTPERKDLGRLPAPLAWVNCAVPCRSNANDCTGFEIHPSPRVDQDGEASCMPDEVLSWAGFESPKMERPPKNFAQRLLAEG